MKIEGYTPKELVDEKLISYLRAVHQTTLAENRLGHSDLTEAQTQAVAKRLALVHNRILDDSGLGGLHI